MPASPLPARLLRSAPLCALVMLNWCIRNLLLLALLLLSPRRWARRLTVATLGSLWLLSACGTAPLQASSCPPVPAELMRLPSPPVLLKPASPSTTPGATTPKTPPAAPPNGPSYRA